MTTRVVVLHADCDSDTQLWTRLSAHLGALIRQGVLEPWALADVPPGENIEAAVDRRLEVSDVALLIISPDFLASVSCVERARRAMEHRNRSVRVLPILARPCHLEHTILSGLKLMPSNGKAITKWRSRDEAMLDVVAGIRAAIVEVGQRPTHFSEVSTLTTGQRARLATTMSQLEVACVRRERLRRAGRAASVLDEEILMLRRALRHGGRLQSGELLAGGRYLLLSEIGRGGFAVVYRAFDKQTASDVAIKVLHTSLAGVPERRERFFRGAKIMATLSHPAIVSVIDEGGIDDGFCYFAMEYFVQGDVQSAVRSGRISRDRALSILLAVGSGLAEAHTRGLVHRDVKPSNILLDEQNGAKLSDFDLVGDPGTTGGTESGALGSFIFAPPELLLRPQDHNTASDVYGLAMSGLFMLHGGDLPAEVVRSPSRVVRSLVQPDSIKQVLRKALSWNPRKRFLDAREFCERLRQAQTEPTAASGAASRRASIVVTAPFPGIFHHLRNQQLPKVGDKVDAGTTLGIIEAFSRMNEIEAESSGFLTRIMIEEGCAVRQGQRLFLLRDCEPEAYWYSLVPQGDDYYVKDDLEIVDAQATNRHPRRIADAQGTDSYSQPELPRIEHLSPFSGTVFFARSPDLPRLRTGSHVRVGQVIFVIEAEGLMNEVRSAVDGIVAYLNVEHGQSVALNQALLEIDVDDVDTYLSSGQCPRCTAHAEEWRSSGTLLICNACNSAFEREAWRLKNMAAAWDFSFP